MVSEKYYFSVKLGKTLHSAVGTEGGMRGGTGRRTDARCLILVYSLFLADESENVRQSVPSTFLLPLL